MIIPMLPTIAIVWSDQGIEAEHEMMRADHRVKENLRPERENAEAVGKDRSIELLR